MMRPLVFQAAPITPTTLTAAASTLSTSPPTVSLTWVEPSPVPAPTLFTLERADLADFSSGLQSFTVNAPATSFVDTTVGEHLTYFYRVRAEDNVAYSAWSDTVTATTPGRLPLAPSNLALFGAAKTALTVVWVDNANNEQGFYLQRRRTGQWATIATLPANTTKYTDSGLVSGTTYRYRIQAYNKDGVSAWSNILQANTLP